MKNINLGSLSIPITQYASQGNAILGIRDSGKSYSATYLAEQLYAADIPFVAFDPSGIWKFLRVPGKGNGLPVVVAGGKSPDLPLTPQSAPEIVRAAMRANVSLVIDLYDIHLSKADWSRIVESCLRVLLYENGEHGLRHIFIEEAAEFCPQQVTPDKSKVYAEMEKLARIGGNALLGYTLINQRAEQVNKAVLELCDCLMLHRQKGKNSLNSLAKWLDYSQGTDIKKIIQSLPTLPSGECWIWAANEDQPVHVKMPQKNTFHPDRRALIANPAAANVKRVDATKFVTGLKANLEKHLQEAKDNDPKVLKARIAELEREIRKPKEQAIDQTALERAHQAGFNEGANHAYKNGWDAHQEALATALAMIPNDPPMLGVMPLATAPQNPARQPPTRAAAQRELRNYDGIPKGEAAVLSACIQFPDGLLREQLTVLTGYKRSSRDTYIQRLREKRLITTDNDRITATKSGIAALPDAEPLPTGKALQDYWLQRLPRGEQAILSELIKAYPSEVPREILSKSTGYERSSRDTYLQRLQAKQLIVKQARGTITASENLF